MSDCEFPSGPWTGFFTYSHVPGRWRTDVHFTFENGRVTGEGTDSVGAFIVAGRYDAAARECFWTKTYVAAHHVFYRGFREGKGIWGTWEIRPNVKGGFQIWPLGSDGRENEAAQEADELPVELTMAGTRCRLTVLAKTGKAL